MVYFVMAVKFPHGKSRIHHITYLKYLTEAGRARNNITIHYRERIIPHMRPGRQPNQPKLHVHTIQEVVFTPVPVWIAALKLQRRWWRRPSSRDRHIAVADATDKATLAQARSESIHFPLKPMHNI